MSANDKLAATFHGAEDLTPEQDLRDAIAERLTDAVHFNGCTDSPCTCLVGRIRWAITAEEIRPDQTTSAIDTMARHLIGLRLRYDEFGAEMWEEIPEVGLNDFAAITKRVESIVTTADPTPAEYDDAYAHLRTRVDGAA
ncbi:MAG TPA: hypothetical protein VGL05_19745 [Kribbella sp.]